MCDGHAALEARCRGWDLPAVDRPITNDVVSLTDTIRIQRVSHAVVNEEPLAQEVAVGKCKIRVAVAGVMLFVVNGTRL